MFLFSFLAGNLCICKIFLQEVSVSVKSYMMHRKLFLVMRISTIFLIL